MASKETGDKRLALVTEHGMANRWDTPTYQARSRSPVRGPAHIDLTLNGSAVTVGDSLT